MSSTVPDGFADDRRAQFAAATVRAASQLVRRVQRALTGDALAKDDRSPVTVADFAAQALVAYKLSQDFAAEPLVGEEDSAALQRPQASQILAQVVGFVGGEIPTATPVDVCQWIDAGSFDPQSQATNRHAAEANDGYWTLDPVDGTKGFLRGDQYAVALAFVAAGKVQIGVLGCPELVAAVRPEPGGQGSLVVASRGRGAWVQALNDPQGSWTRLAVSGIADPPQMRLLRSVESGHTDADGIGNLASALAIEAAPTLMDSQAKYAVLAAGGGEALLRLLSPSRPNYREMIWDQAAGSIVVEEAGGRVTDLDGQPLDFSRGRTLAANRGVLATNGLAHGALLSGLRQIGA